MLLSYLNELWIHIFVITLLKSRGFSSNKLKQRLVACIKFWIIISIRKKLLIMVDCAHTLTSVKVSSCKKWIIYRTELPLKYFYNVSKHFRICFKYFHDETWLLRYYSNTEETLNCINFPNTCFKLERVNNINKIAPTLCSCYHHGNSLTQPLQVFIKWIPIEKRKSWQGNAKKRRNLRWRN